MPLQTELMEVKVLIQNDVLKTLILRAGTSNEKTTQHASFDLIDTYYKRWLRSECLQFTDIVRTRTGMQISVSYDLEKIKIAASW